jgi:DNA-binding transcriptional regulator YhcF (GntR family)
MATGPMCTIDPGSDLPPFEQVRSQIARAAADGALPPGHRLPTVRALAAELDLAVNTVAKAYRALESDGVVETRGRAGTVVAPRHGQDPDARSAADQFVRAARRLGLSRDEAILLVESSWDPPAR